MTFPRTGLPQRVDVWVRQVKVNGSGVPIRDSDDNEQFEPQKIVDARPARRYRDIGVETQLARQGVRVSAFLAFAYEDGDAIDEKVELQTFELDGSGNRVNEQGWDVVWVRRMDLWSRPSHWELGLQEAR